ncbi:MAG: large conductance mechanosensitive channel protein MscL [Clostridia bacterium]|nr:large conductance mechanosensitive channel protein MscL [Clostridia bacterium]
MAKDKGFVAEFKKFIMRGNVIDLAVGVIIGGAFQAIVNSLVDDIIMPVISIFTKGISFEEWVLTVGGATIKYGNFISAILNFLIMALVIFLIVKSINKVNDKFSKKEEEPAPTTKECPFCKSEISIDAVKCPHCTSDIPAEEE